ncbi:MAG: ABC transporter ATP-binding protein [Nitrosopumilaceae archaeon]
MTLISVENLKTTYYTSRGTVQAVDGVSFSLECGESIGIAGESACGKSTLGLSIMRTIPEHSTMSGDIKLDGKSILKMSKLEFAKNIRWKDISMVFQGAMNSLDPVFTIEEQFVEVLKQHHFEGDYKQKISEMIDSVGLPQDVLKRYPHELSGGMKQRIVIAMALILKPKFVIADEPTTALDVLVQAQIINLLKKLKKNGMSVMLITHDLAIISEIAEKIGIMYAGEMIEFGTASEIYKNPKHPYTQGLLKSIPRLRGDKVTNYIKGTPPSLINPPKGCRFLERCSQAMEKCKKDVPNYKTDSGYVKCFLYE